MPSRAVEAEAERVADWLGDVRFSPGFLPPFQRGLADLATRGRKISFAITSRWICDVPS